MEPQEPEYPTEQNRMYWLPNLKMHHKFVVIKHQGIDI